MTQPAPPAQTRPKLTVAQAYDAAASLHRKGRLQQAEQGYRAVLRVRPDHAGALHYLGVICTQKGQFDEGAELIRRAIAREPKLAAAHNDLGVAHAAQGRQEQAIAEYEQAVAIDPNYVEARNNLGVALLAARRYEDAIRQFESALVIKQESAELHNNLANVFAAMARSLQTGGQTDTATLANDRHLPDQVKTLTERAIAEYEKALAIVPTYAEARHNLANALAAAGRSVEALAHFETAIALKPDVADLHNDFGRLLAKLERHGNAVDSYRKAIALNPNFAEAHHNLGRALAATDRHAEAATHCRRALALRPEFAEAYTDLGHALAALARTEDAAAAFERALAIAPDLAEAHRGLGDALQTLGRLAESKQAFTRAVELAPGNANYHFNLAFGKRFSPGDPQLAAMEDLAQNMAELPEREQMELHYALGKAYDDLARHEQAFSHLLTANALRRKRTRYDEAWELASFERFKTIFTPELMQQKRGLGEPSSVPIFIVGMPRSGSTLVEQILASHPDVFGAGERPDLFQAVQELNRTTETRLPFPQLVPSMTASQLRQFGARYLAGVRSAAPAAKRITDKMPTNFWFIGLICLALPNARIIHTRRHPIDTCLSCFSHLFRRLEWSNDLAELGRYYRAYTRLMAHWRRVMPDGMMLEVQYEDVVADIEAQARSIVAHCGLEWSERCLSFHETERPIHTTSVVQVRQPVYRTSVARWRAYEPWLGPLLDALGEAKEGFV